MSAKHPSKQSVPAKRQSADTAKRVASAAPMKTATRPTQPAKPVAKSSKPSVKQPPIKAPKSVAATKPAKAAKPEKAAKASKPAKVVTKPAKAVKVVTKPAKAAKPAAKPAKAAKPTPKAAKPAKKPVKPAPKAVKPAPKAAKPAAKPAPVAEVAVPVKAAKVAPVAVEPAKNHSPQPAKEKANHHAAKPEPATEAAEHASKKAAPVRRSSLVDFPVPPPPVRPPFVPPKTTTVSLDEVVPSGTNASHSPAFIQKQRARLLDLRDDLVDALSGMTRDTIRNAPEGSEASGSGMHQGDAGSDAYDRDFALSVLAKEQDALYEIDQALRRIQKGNYGVCEISNRKIPQARLEAIPFARLTVECQAQWEKEYGNRRFRPSNEVGFSGGNLIEDEDSETVLLDDEEE
jgi:RNA polymerase-binding transcription factor DksA